MRVLLDHCVPWPFSRLLVGHDVRTARRMGWDALSNGPLLAAIGESAEFDCLVTVDRSLMREQSLVSPPVPIIVIRTPSSAIDVLSELAPEVLGLLGQSLQRRVYVVGEGDAAAG